MRDERRGLEDAMGLYDRDGRREFPVSAVHWEPGNVSFVVYMRRPFSFFCIIRFFTSSLECFWVPL